MTIKETIKMIMDRLDRLDSHLSGIDKTLVKQEANLEKHMLRTDQNETMIQIIAEDIKPVKKHVTQVEGILKFIGLISLILGIALSIIKIVA